MDDGILVIPGSGTVTPTNPGLLYGEGVFETLHLRPEGPWLLGEHLDRLERSAALLGLAPPPRAELEALAARAPLPATESALRLVVTPGPVAVAPVFFATVADVPGSARRQRHEGISLITADLGVTTRPPWSLSAAKTLSYAENLAARRWAQRQGADDVLWLTADGHALESPTANLVWLAGDTLCTVPPAGILRGITAAHLLSRAASVGLGAEERMITAAALPEADAIWLSSSLRGLAEVHTLNGVSRPPSPWTPRLLALLGYAGL